MRRAGVIAAGAALVIAVGGAAAFQVANADSVLVDGYYACTFPAGSLSCQETALPTISVTETATATTTVTQAVPGPTTTVTAQPLVRWTGVSSPGLAVWPDPEIVRYFWSGLPSSALPPTPAGVPIVVSFKTVPTGAAFGSDLDAWASTGRTVYWAWHHEPDNGDMTGAAFVTQMNALLDVADQHRYVNVHSMTILTAGALANGTAEAYYVPRAELVGFDCYTLSNEPKALAYAQAKGKRLIFAEVGNKTTGQANSDAEALAYAKAFWPALDSNVVAAVWWSGSTDTLTDKPNTLAYLRAQ